MSQEVPASLDDPATFIAVRTIDLTSNKLTQLPAFLGNFAILQRLTLSRNSLTTLPGELCYLTSLKASCLLLIDQPSTCGSNKSMRMASVVFINLSTCSTLKLVIAGLGKRTRIVVFSILSW